MQMQRPTIGIRTVDFSIYFSLDSVCDVDECEPAGRFPPLRPSFYGPTLMVRREAIACRVHTRPRLTPAPGGRLVGEGVIGEADDLISPVLRERSLDESNSNSGSPYRVSGLRSYVRWLDPCPCLIPACSFAVESWSGGSVYAPRAYWHRRSTPACRSRPRARERSW